MTILRQQEIDLWYKLKSKKSQNYIYHMNIIVFLFKAQKAK